MSIIKSNAVAPPPSGGLSSISEMNSLRFDGSSYLSKDFSGLTATERQKRTYSFWIKRSELSTLQQIASRYYPRSSADWNAFQSGALLLLDTDKIQYSDRDYGSGIGDIIQNADPVNRDTSAWFHLVCSINTIHSERPQAEGVKFYINGEPVSTTHINIYGDGYQCELFGTGTNYIGAHLGVGYDRDYFKGYLADFYFITGQALDHNSFGETISDIWVPKAYSGTYGTNGFHLDFADGIETLPVNGSNVSAFRDKSGNDNHWQAH